MATITEDYVSFETAKLLKEKGFDVDSWFHYDNDKDVVTRGYRLNHPDDIPAWTQQMVMKWLREVYNLSVRPRYEEVEDEKELLHNLWFFDILSMNPYKMLIEPKQGYDTYEEAAENAIKYCLEKLI